MDITRFLGTAIAGGILIIIIGSISDFLVKKLVILKIRRK